MKGKKLLALVLCLLMTVSMLPISAFADGDGYGEITINLGGGEGGGQQNSDTYVVAGSANENVNEGGVATPIFGTAWDPTLAANQMTESNGVYTKTYTVSDACNVQFKVVKNGTTWIGNGDESNVSVSIPAGSKFTVNLNPSTNAITTSVTMDYTAIYLASDLINNWAPNGKLMTQVQPGIWETQLTVPAGHYYYKFTVDGSWDRNFGKGPYQSTFITGSSRESKYNGNDNMDLVFDTETTVTLRLDLSNFNYQTKSGAKYGVFLPKTTFKASPLAKLDGTSGNFGSYLSMTDGGYIQLLSGAYDYMNRPKALPAGTEIGFKVAVVNGYTCTVTAKDEDNNNVAFTTGSTTTDNQGRTVTEYSLTLPASDVIITAAFSGESAPILHTITLRPSLYAPGASVPHVMTDAEKAEAIQTLTVEPAQAYAGETVTMTLVPKQGYYIVNDNYGTYTKTAEYTYEYVVQDFNSVDIILSIELGSGLNTGYYVQVGDAAQGDWIPLVNEYPFNGGVTTVWDGQASLTAGQVLTAWYVSNPGANPVQKGSTLTVDASGDATVYYVNEGQGSLYVSDLDGYYLVHSGVTGSRPYQITAAEAFTAQTDGSYTYDGTFRGGNSVEVAQFENGKVVALGVGSKTSIYDVPRNDEGLDGFPYDGAAGRATFYPDADGTNCNVKENVLRVSRIFNIGYSTAYTNFTVRHLDAIHNNNTAAAGETVNILVTPHAGSNYRIISVTAAQGDTPVAVTAGESSTYSFVMPAGDVTVTVETAEAAASLAFLGAGLQRRVLNATGEIIDYETNIRFGFELTLPDGAVVDTDASYFRWNLTTEATADTGNKIDIKNVDTTGAKPIVNMVITGVPKSFYSTNITCFVHLVYTVGGNSCVLEQGGFVRSVVQVCNGLLNSAAASDAWKTYAQSLLDAISE